MDLVNCSPSELQLANAPKVAGLRFRSFAGPVDLPPMLEVLMSSKLADGLEEGDSLEQITNTYAHLENCNPYEDMIIAEVNGRMVGYSRVTYHFEDNTGDGIYYLFGFIRPEWRRHGIGRAMMQHNEEHLRQIAAGHTVKGKKFYETFLQTTQLGAIALTLQSGYQPVRYSYIMIRPDLENLPDALMPEGLEVRPASMEHVRQIWDASQEAFQDHWGYAREGEEEYQSWLNWPYFKPELWQVAWEGDQVAGMVLNFINTAENEQFNRKRGWTENIAVRRPWRKRGLARALIVRSLAMLKEMGMTEAALGVDTQNTSGALRVYESCGFKPVFTSINYRKEMVV
jgi:mycothiol synthase